MNLDVHSIVEAPLRLLVFFVLLLVVRGLPALLVYRRALSMTQRLQMMFITATALPLLVALAEIGLRNGTMLPENAAALVGAGVLSVIVYPAIAVAIGARRAARAQAAPTFAGPGGSRPRPARPASPPPPTGLASPPHRPTRRHPTSRALIRPRPEPPTSNPAVPEAPAEPGDAAGSRGSDMRNRETIREYVTGSLWVLPGFSAVLALVGRVHPVPHPYRSGVAVGVPRHRRRCAHPAEQRDRHGGDRDRIGARPDRCCAATVLDAVFATVATELPAGSADPGRAQHLRRDLRLFRGRPVHGGAIRRGAHRGLPTAGGHRGHRRVVRQPGHGGVFRGPPRTLHPDRRDRQTG